ncbi:hypothetical protein Cpir12675_005778 [Ceratocystis pirilliformis]|uniref:BHLH domain-containing protein n=1 Tax=Ceratocystis pirilliformis TaxID=259994 RepID=A0ABR3YMN1_9PEZI
MDFNSFFAVNENGESSSTAAARQAQEAALWQAAAGFGSDNQQQQALFNHLAQHQSQASQLQQQQQPGLDAVDAAANLQISFGSTPFASGPQSTLAERPSQAQAQAQQPNTPQHQHQHHQQMAPPRRRDHHGHDRKRPKTNPKDPALDSVDYWIHYDDDDDANKLDESFEINFSRRNLPPQFQPRPIPPFNPLTTTTPGLGTGLYTNPINTIIKPDDFIIDEAALDSNNNPLSEEDDLLNSMNLGEQLSKIDSLPPNPTQLPPRENLYSTPLSWEKPLLGNTAMRMEPSPLDAGINPPQPPVPTNMDFANPILNEAEQRRLLAIALNSNRNVPYNAFPFGNYSPSLFAGGMGATMLNPETASLFEQAFNTSNSSDLGQSQNININTGMQRDQQRQQQKQQSRQQPPQQTGALQYQQRPQEAQKRSLQQQQPTKLQIPSEPSPQTQAQTDSTPQQPTPNTESKGSPTTASTSMANAPYATPTTSATATTSTATTTKTAASTTAGPATAPGSASTSVAPGPIPPAALTEHPAKATDRTAHNDIERKYRTNLKDKIAELRDAIPALRGLVDEEEDDGTPRPQKVSKGTVLTKATDYIHTLERRNKAIMKEHQDLSRRLQAFEQLLNATARQPFLMPNYSRALFDPRGFC